MRGYCVKEGRWFFMQLSMKNNIFCHQLVNQILDLLNHHSRQLSSSETSSSLQSLLPSQTKSALMQRPLEQVNSVSGLHVGKGQPCSSLLSPQSSMWSQV